MKQTSKNNIFGTDGIRKKVGQSPLTYSEIIKLGKAIAIWSMQTHGKTPKILLGHDTRESCFLIKAALKTGLLLWPVEIYDAQVLPTPALSAIMQQDKQFDVAIVITASHNPYEDNGIKIIDTKKGKLSLEDEQIIQDHFFSKKAETISYAHIGKEYLFTEGIHTYIDLVTNKFEKNFLHGLKIVLDCANGAASYVAPAIFSSLGADVVAIAKHPDGKNINNNCGSQSPQKIQKAVLKEHADIGFAFDGDGDRITAVTKDGQIKDGDDILSLLSQHPIYKQQPQIVGTILSNYGLQDYLKRQNQTLIRTNVGDKFVVQAMKEQNLLLGGEQSGHIILYDYLPVSDGIFTALRILETIQETQNIECTTFTKYPQVMTNIPVIKKKNLNASPIANIICAYKKSLNKGNIIVRYSGTENLLRVMVEAENNTIAQHTSIKLSNDLKKELNL